MSHEVAVELAGGRGYSILIAPDALQQLGARCIQVARSRRAVVITQPAVQRAWGALVQTQLRDVGFEVDTICYPSGERFKTLATVEKLYQGLYDLTPALDRKTLLVALGGGVVGDMVGFVAASYLRGLDFVQVPTTLLAMVDSSVGGKTGVDFRAGKNLIGAFHQPRAVVIDPRTLGTLPRREIRSGLAEVIKYGVIQDPDLLTYLDGHASALLHREPEAIAHIVARSCEIKASVVCQDEKEETGLRAILNFGHTIGHALEAATQYRRYKHGEAIGIGMISAAWVGQEAGVTPRALVPRLLATLKALGLPTDLPSDVSDDTLLELTARDKKAEKGEARFVLAARLGEVSLQSVDVTHVRRGLELHRAMGQAG